MAERAQVAAAVQRERAARGKDQFARSTRETQVEQGRCGSSCDVAEIDGGFSDLAGPSRVIKEGAYTGHGREKGLWYAEQAGIEREQQGW